MAPNETRVKDTLIVALADYMMTQTDDQGLLFCKAKGVDMYGISSWRNIIPSYTLDGAVTEINAEGVFALEAAAMLCAVAGDSVSFWLGRRLGPAVLKREDSKLLNKKHLLRAHSFYEKHGSKTVVLARFIPIIRTFCPLVAGAAMLVAQAMGNWSFTEAQALKVKMLLLMTASETGVEREALPDPDLSRGGKDRVEGFGRLNADAAVAAVRSRIRLPFRNNRLPQVGKEKRPPSL